MILVGHMLVHMLDYVLDYIPNHVLDHIIVGFVTMALYLEFGQKSIG